MRVAAVQFDVQFGDLATNVATVLETHARLAASGVDLVVYPEAALTGYCAGSAEEAARIAITDDQLAPLQAQVDGSNTGIVVGFAERTFDGALANSAALLEPGRAPRVYRKTHLPFLGMDRFMTVGDTLPVYDTRWGRIAVLICYDLRFPEAVRAQALAGAELLVLPTNWPEGAEVSCRCVAAARAAENRIYVVTCNRAGTEHGFRFIGESRILDLDGRELAVAPSGSAVIAADVDLPAARQKRRVVVAGEYETDVFADRRPNLYASVQLH